MRPSFFLFFAFFAAMASLLACVGAPTPEANGYNVQLYFEGAPLGASLPVGTPSVVTVHRIEQQVGLCASQGAGCDPTSETPIAFVSATCDGACTVTPVAATGTAVVLEATSSQAGGSTLKVRVRSVIDGSEWDDGYPLTFRATRHDVRHAPSLLIDNSPSEK